MTLDPKPPVSLRIATEADTSAISHLGSTVFRTTFGHSCTAEQMQTFLDESYAQSSMLKDIKDPNKDLIVAEGPGGKILGFALLTRGSSEPCVETVPSKIELQRLYVDLDAQGLGLGKTLLDEAETTARKQGYRHMWLGVWEENHRAQHVYKKNGYSRVGEHDFDLGGDIQTDHILIKEL